MAITRAQIARQLYQFGGGADAGGIGSPGRGTFGGASKSPNAGGDTTRSRIQQDRQADFKAQTQRQNVDAMREGLRKNISPSFGERVGSFIKGGGVIGGLLRNFIKSSPEIFSDFTGSKTLKQFIDKRKQRKIDSLSEEEDNDEDKQLNVITNLIEDQGLMEVPPAVIDQGLMEVPGDNLNLDEGLMVAPGAMIDQGLMTAPGGIIDEGLMVPLSVGGRVNAMGGGIMDLNTVRQMMFIGGIAKAAKKAVKKATRAVKSIAKSPIGKAALAYGAFQFGPGALKSFKGADTLTKALISSGILMGAPFVFGSDEKEEVVLPDNLGPELTPAQILAIQGKPFDTLTRRIAGSQFAAEGGRIGFNDGSEKNYSFEQFMKDKGKIDKFFGEEQMRKLYEKMMNEKKIKEQRSMVAKGGSMKEPVAKKIMPLLDMDGQEMDLRAEGGFVPIGRMEKADDVPARLSKNEFVFTADAVRNAGEGDVDKGAEVMYNMMKNLEAGGEVSEESQGLDGARKMFQTSQRLEEVI
jgi:hypothetical protein